MFYRYGSDWKATVDLGLAQAGPTSATGSYKGKCLSGEYARAVMYEATPYGGVHKKFRFSYSATSKQSEQRLFFPL